MKIGRAVFKENTPKKILTPQIQTLISNDSFWAIGNIQCNLIDHKRYQKQSWVVIFG